MNWYVTFSGAKYHDTTRRIVEDAPRFGADRVLVYDDHWLTTCRPAFVGRNRWLFEHHATRGFGWFVWKPYVILDALRRAAPGDVVLFTDGDCYPVASLGPLYERCRADGGVMLFEAMGCPQAHWCKRDVFLVMACDRPEYHGAKHAVARFMLFEKGGAFPTEEFLYDWLVYTCNPLVNTFDPSVIAPALGLPELPGFTQNRCEQSVLSNLAVQYGCRLYREACQFGKGSQQDRDIYGDTFFQHGGHTYGPDGEAGVGSAYRNVND